jgi:ubiquinone/menaquinone biosynthesis C-methylase UbiE
MKDLFSSHASAYAQYRPTYPAQLYDLLRKLCKEKERAWDCGTGNGQVAGELAAFFDQVYATDISINQLSQAVQKPNIHYTGQAAESTNFPDDHFDLVTVAQAVHWFDFDAFYSEVKRVLKPGAPIAIFGYGLFKANEAFNEIIDHLYQDLVGPYWDEERRFLEEKYQTIPFPFEGIPVPHLEMKQQWSFERLIGYLQTWSAVKAYEKDKEENPVALVKERLQKSFGELGEVRFPIYLRVGKNI